MTILTKWTEKLFELYFAPVISSVNRWIQSTGTDYPASHEHAQSITQNINDQKSTPITNF